MLLLIAHSVAVVLLGLGLAATWNADRLARRAQDLREFSGHIQRITLLQSRLVGPASILVLVSGALMLHGYRGMEAVPPWLAGMTSIFGFQFLLGVTAVRRHYVRLDALSQQAIADWTAADTLARECRKRPHAVLRELDIYLFCAAVYYGAAKPANALEAALVLFIAVLMALAVAYVRGNSSPLQQ